MNLSPLPPRSLLDRTPAWGILWLLFVIVVVLLGTMLHVRGADGSAPAAPAHTDWFTLISMIANVLLGCYAKFAQNRATGATNTAANLVQTIQTGRELLNQTGASDAIEARWKEWMKQSQAQAGVAQNVARLVAEQADPYAAREAAQAILTAEPPRPAREHLAPPAP